MIKLYSGTPGSGKSYHTAYVMYQGLRHGRSFICNFPINLDNASLSLSSYYKRKVFGSKEKLRHRRLGTFVYKNNSELTPEFLLKYAKEHHSFKKEGETTVIIDECGIIFNARSWDNGERLKWIEFFSMHRHFGYNIILVSQSDRLIDRQIRCFVEYDVKHRKINNYKLFGRILGLLSGGCLFACVTCWYGIREKVGCDFLRYSRRVASIYDTFLLFGDLEEDKGALTRGEGCAERGVPSAGGDAPMPTDGAREADEVSVSDATGGLWVQVQVFVSKFFDLFGQFETHASHPDELE